MDQQVSASFFEARVKPFMKSGGSIFPFVVFWLFFLLMNIPFFKISGLFGWSSIADTLNSLYLLVLQLSTKYPWLPIPSSIGSFGDMLHAVFWGLFSWTFLVAVGKHFSRTKLGFLALIWVGALFYAGLKLFLAVDYFFAILRAIPNDSPGLFVSLPSAFKPELLFSPPVVGGMFIGIAICLVYFIITGLEVSFYRIALAIRPSFETDFLHFLSPVFSERNSKRVFSFLFLFLAFASSVLCYVLAVNAMESYIYNERESSYKVEARTIEEQEEDEMSGRSIKREDAKQEGDSRLKMNSALPADFSDL